MIEEVGCRSDALNSSPFHSEKNLAVFDDVNRTFGDITLSSHTMGSLVALRLILDTGVLWLKRLTDSCHDLDAGSDICCRRQILHVIRHAHLVEEVDSPSLPNFKEWLWIQDQKIGARVSYQLNIIDDVIQRFADDIYILNGDDRSFSLPTLRSIRYHVRRLFQQQTSSLQP
jgi:hypothetical protein